MSWIITGTEKYETDPYRSQVSLLLHGDGASGSTTIVDNSPSPKTVTAVGNAQISTAQSKFGGASIYFPGSSYLLSSGVPAFGVDDWTIEFWAYFTFLNTYSMLVDFRLSGGSIAVPLIYIVSSKLRYHTNGADRITGGTTVSLSNWHHIAVSKSAGSTKLFLDGQQEGSTYSDSVNYANNANRPVIGISDGLSVTTTFIGYIDDLRITKGVARYTSNFTPPTAPFPDA